MEFNKKIIIKGAREHNLKNISIDIPRDSLIVFTGLSGSGKSSLAFDTIYAEGQRRYIESLSAYARQFLGVLEKPEVDLIEGLSPAISIEQKSIAHNPRSTVGTVTEIYDYLRLLYSKIGKPFCYNCGKPVEKQNSEQIVESVLKSFNGQRITILAPLVRGRKGHYRELFEDIQKDGFVRARVDGEILELSTGFKVDRYKIHNIELVVDRLKIENSANFRIIESIEVGLNYGEGTIIIFDGKKEYLFSRNFVCLNCNISYKELAPNSFSFNSPYGLCADCEGLGEKRELDVGLIIPDWNATINDGGLAPLGKPRNIWFFNQLEGVSQTFGFSFNTKLKLLTKEQLDILLNGTKEKIEFTYTYGGGKSVTYRHKFTGLMNHILHNYSTTSSNSVREWAESFMSVNKCSTCNGAKLQKESLAVKINDLNISEITNLSLPQAKKFFQNLKLSEREKLIAKPILKEITERIEFLLNVGLSYLTLGREARTLSGGESQRIRLATQIGTQLSGVLYVLDEPSIGLHQADNLKLINSLKNLKKLGNTIIVVEHDRETIENSDYLVDLGPFAGEHGGKICAHGKFKQLLKSEKHNSLTIDYLLDKKSIPFNSRFRNGSSTSIRLIGASGNNLKNITVEFPTGKFIAVTGLSGSGKSTLINDTLVRIIQKKLYHSKVNPLEYESIEGIENIDKLIEIDQSPIGRTPRSNPATYIGLFTHIRDLFTELPEAKIRGYKAGRFSFNVKSGRCEICEGAGLQKIEMNFLPDVFVKCEGCGGKRYNQETLEILYKTKSINDVLEMTVESASEFFEEIPVIKRKLKALLDVGLGYIKLGQQATTLSGGEAQRVKLAAELSKVGTGKTLYVLDEPTTGLHFHDVKVLLDVLNKLVDKGNTLIVIEHNIDVIKMADYIIDLGPEGGDKGGQIVAAGTPLDIMNCQESVTGKFLKMEFQRLGAINENNTK